MIYPTASPMIHFTGTAHAPTLQLRYAHQPHYVHQLGANTVSIPFTQYTLPNGLKKPISIHCRANVEEKAHRIIKSGYRFECEVLTTGEVSLTITNGEDGDVAIEVVPNDAAVPTAVESLINKFEKDLSP